MAATDDRHGQVIIAPHLDGGFGAYWDNEEPDKDEPPAMLEEAFPFNSLLRQEDFVVDGLN